MRRLLHTLLRAVVLSAILLSVVLLLSILLPMRTPGSPPGDERYQLPLGQRYELDRADRIMGGKCVLSERASPGMTVISGVQQVAVAGHLIAGQTSDGYFLLDTTQTAPPRIMPTQAEWKRALEQAGVKREVVLLEPDILAAALPDSVLRPWMFRLLRGRLGLSDDAWSLVLQVVGLVCAFIIGMRRDTLHIPAAEAIALGIGMNIVAQIIIAGGGPGACVGFFVLPLLYVCGAALGSIASRVYRRCTLVPTPPPIEG